MLIKRAGGILFAAIVPLSLPTFVETAQAVPVPSVSANTFASNTAFGGTQSDSDSHTFITSASASAADATGPPG